MIKVGDYFPQEFNPVTTWSLTAEQLIIEKESLRILERRLKELIERAEYFSDHPGEGHTDQYHFIEIIKDLQSLTNNIWQTNAGDVNAP